MVLHDGGYWRVSDIGYGDDLYVRAPRLLKDRDFDSKSRRNNWDYSMTSKRNFKRMPAYLIVDEDPEEEGGRGTRILAKKAGLPPGRRL